MTQPISLKEDNLVSVGETLRGGHQVTTGPVKWGGRKKRGGWQEGKRKKLAMQVLSEVV